MRPTESPTPSWSWVDVACVLGLSLLAVSFSLRLWQFNFEDALIVFRISENIASGAGWVFNLGEPTNASTSALWTLLLAAGSWIAGSVPPAAHFLDGLAWMGLGIVFYSCLRLSMARSFAFLAALAFVTDTIVRISTGMESHLFILWALLAVWAELRGHEKRLGVFLGLLGLTRPDGVLLAVLLYLRFFLRRRRVPWQALVIPALFILPWLVFSELYFGSLFPNTLSAKMAQGRSGLWSVPAPLNLPLPLFCSTGLEILKTTYPQLIRVGWLLMVLPGGFLLLLRVSQGSGRRSTALDLLLFPVWSGLMVMFYSGLKVPAYHWYLLPVLLSCVVCAAWLLQELLFTARRWGQALGGLGAVAMLVTIGWGLRGCYLMQLPEPRTIAYQEVCRWITSEHGPRISLAAAEIGTVGYYSRLRIVDMGALLHSDAPAHLRAGELDWWMRRKPDLVLAHTPSWRLESPVESDDDYRLIKEFEFPGYGKLRVFGRTP